MPFPHDRPRTHRLLPASCRCLQQVRQRPAFGILWTDGLRLWEPVGRQMGGMMGEMVLFIEGYDEDKREIYAIPEVRAFFQNLWQRWPYWLYFCHLNAENLMMMVMCYLDSMDALKVQRRDQVQLRVEPMEVLQFISSGFKPMNELCERVGMSERQIFERTKAVFEYFKLPFEAAPPV
jgi:hypothetical protein